MQIPVRADARCRNHAAGADPRFVERAQVKRGNVSFHPGTSLAALLGFPHEPGASMDKDRIKGAAKEVTGKVKTATGKALGDEKLKNEGRADQVKGKVQNTVGGIKDTIREADKESQKP
jgi:uncharacterized protein YjbJ (UPF0337 family)